MTGKTQLSAKNELQAELDEALEDISRVREILSDAFTPQATRTQLANAVSEALGELEEYDDEDDESGDDEDDESGDDDE